VSHLVFVLAAILVVLAAVNAIFVTTATVIDARRLTAVARALGATPGQVTAALTGAQIIPALAATVVGIPAGVGLYALAARGGPAAPPLAAMLAVVPLTLIAVAALTALPARNAARRPVAEALRSD
jgi:putative ABC transport system permease protein